MKSTSDIIKSNEIPDNYKYYWNYQHELGKQFIVPYSLKIGCFEKGDSVFEVGSAEGGVLTAFVEAGGVEAVGSDIAQNRLEMGEKITKILELPITFSNHNIITEEIPEEWINKFNLVLLRDVIEHLDDTSLALNNIKKIIKPNGFLFVSFPPYYSAFGGHQHTLGNNLGKLPFIHLLPNRFFHKLIASGREADIEEVKRLQDIKLTTKKFENTLNKTGFEIHKKEFYLLRPVYKMKFGLPTIKLTKLSFLPFIKKFISLEALYVLRKIK
ncbi:MAG: class I SAM-dependent methyltransferase [bacterium]